MAMLQKKTKTLLAEVQKSILSLFTTTLSMFVTSKKRHKALLYCCSVFKKINCQTIATHNPQAIKSANPYISHS